MQRRKASNIMFCRNCGKEIADDAVFCASCGIKVCTAHSENVKDYLAEAILVTIFCCLPFGIPAIVYAAKVASCMASHDMLGAKAASAKARVWCIAAFSVGLGLFLLAFSSALLDAFAIN